MKTSLNSNRDYFPHSLALILVAMFAWSALVAEAADIFWSGGTASYTNAAGWGGTVPGDGDHAINNSGSNNVVQINSGDPDWTLVDLIAGNADNTSGAYVQNGATIKVGNPGGWFRFGVNNGSFGIYTLNNGTLNSIDQLHVGENGQGVLNINGGTITKSGGQFSISDTGTAGAAGVVNQTGGIVNSTSEFWVGNNIGTGTFNMSGGSFTNSNWFAVGRFGANGTLIMRGGSITKIGGGNFYVGEGAGVGQFDFSGGTISIDSEFWLANSGTSVAVQNMSGTAAMTVGNWIAIGRNGGNGTLNLTNGTINKIGSGNLAIGAGGGAVGVVNQYGGAIINTANSGSFTYLSESGGNGTWNLNGGTNAVGVLQFNQGGTGVGLLNLNGGLLSVSEVNSGVDGANGTFNFNGGTLQAARDNLNFFHGVGVAYVQAGGAIIDSQGFAVTLAQSLFDNGGGGLTKAGTGTLALTGANSYTGPTLINAGTLALRTDSSGASGNYTVASGAQLSVSVLYLNAQLNLANMTCASPTNTLGFDLGAFGNPSVAPLNVTGNLAVNGTVSINVADTTPQIGQFPLIKYGTKTGAGSFVLGSLQVGVVATIVNNAGNNSIDLHITSVNLPRWDGLAGGNWDIGLTTNWVNIGDGLPTFYGQGNAVLFNDSALGTTTVNLTTTLTPSSVTINNSSLAYTLNGSGKISGSAALTKQGSGVATIANTGGNDYTGPTAIAGGVLSVTSLANGGSPSAIGASSASPTNLVLANGTLSYSGPAISINRGYSVQNTNSSIDTVSNLTLSGLATTTPGGGFIKAGDAQLTYTTAGSNSLSGAVSPGYLVQAGTVLFDGSTGGQTNNIGGNLVLGNVPNTTGTLIVNSNVNLTVGSWFIFGDGANSVGTCTLNGGTVNVNSGNLLMGGNQGTTSTLNINSGVFNKSGGTIIIAPGDWNGAGARTGTVNQTGGTFTFSDEIQIGQVALGTGFYNLHGGVVNSTGWFVIGRAGGSGTMIMDGGILNHTSDGQPAFIVGSGAGNNGLASVGILNHSAGTINCTSEYWVGENTLAVGTNNISGSAVVNVDNWVSLGRGGQAVVNFSGGTFSKTGGGNFIIGDNGNALFNQTGGALTVNNEFWIGQAGGGVGQYDLSAGTASVNSWMAVGRGGATGVLNISGGGSLTKFGDNGSHITVGSGGPGTVNQTGGTITSTLSSTFIGEGGQPGIWNMNGGSAVLSTVFLPINNGANGTLNLNGGTFSTTELASGNVGGTGALNFNGGTLVAGASTANFLHDITSANVLGGGAVIDSGTNVISVAQPLLDGGGAGGLTKIGNGTLYLNGANTYTGPTLVNVGTLGGTGTIAGPVTVAGGATLAPGAPIGTLTVNNTATLGGTTVMEISKVGGVPASSLLAVSGNLAFGGSLNVVLTGTSALAFNDTFHLFTWGTQSGSFATTSLPAGYLWETSQLYVNGTIRVIGVTPPKVNPPTVAGGNLVLTGVGGPAGSSYTWLTSTNVAAPLANWTTNTSGVFDGSGGFSNAFPINASERVRLFRLKTP